MSRRFSKIAIHSLQSSDRYGVNTSDEKKVFFHALARVITENVERPAGSSPSGGLIESIISQVRVLSSDQGEDLLKRVKDGLAASNIEVHFTSDYDGGAAETDADFKKKLRKLLDEHVTWVTRFVHERPRKSFRELMWCRVRQASDAVLLSPRGFELKGPLSSTVIDRSVHTQLPRSYRPNSTVLDSPGLMSPTGENGNDAAETMGSPLIHLAKSRPRPARNQKPQLVCTFSMFGSNL